MIKINTNAYYKYKDICREMGDKELQGGKNRQIQLDNWRQYYDIEKIASKYYIRKQYDDYELRIIENHGKYTTYIENLLIKNLCDIKDKQKDGKGYIVLTNRDILEMACMVNDKYFSGKNHPYAFLNNFKYDVNSGDIPNEAYAMTKVLDDTNIFFSASYRLLKRIIYDSLKSMERRSLIVLNKTYRLYKNYKDKYGIWRQEIHNCNDEDVNRILSVQRRAIEIFNKESDVWKNGSHKYYIKELKNIAVLYQPEKERFFKTLNNELIKEFKKEGYNAYSNAWRLNIPDKESFDYVIEKMNYLQLNQNVQNKLLTAKDLSIISATLKAQMINLFIKL